MGDHLNTSGIGSVFIYKSIQIPVQVHMRPVLSFFVVSCRFVEEPKSGGWFGKLYSFILIINNSALICARSNAVAYNYQ